MLQELSFRNCQPVFRVILVPPKKIGLFLCQTAALLKIEWQTHNNLSDHIF